MDWFCLLLLKCEGTFVLLGYKFCFFVCYLVLIWTSLKKLTFHSTFKNKVKVKCAQFHMLKAISQKMWMFFVSSYLGVHTTNRKQICVNGPHSCIHHYLIYFSICWPNALLCLTCFWCHDDERHLLFSAESPLWPMLLTSCLHYSQVEW